MATKITPLRLTEEERDFLQDIGEGSIIHGVRACIEIAKDNIDKKSGDQNSIFVRKLLRELGLDSDYKIVKK